MLFCVILKLIHEIRKEKKRKKKKLIHAVFPTDVMSVSLIKRTAKKFSFVKV
jgi:hypothetical protein